MYAVKYCLISIAGFDIYSMMLQFVVLLLLAKYGSWVGSGHAWCIVVRRLVFEFVTGPWVTFDDPLHDLLEW